MTDSLVVNEIYLSLQGESTFAGLPCNLGGDAAFFATDDIVGRMIQEFLQ